MASSAFEDAQVVRGLIVSGDQFIHDNAVIDNIVRYFPHPQAVEMEAAAIAQTCFQMNMPFVIIRAVSDSAEEEAKVSFETFLQTAAQHSAKMVQAMIQVL